MAEMYDNFSQITRCFEEKAKKLTSGDGALIFKLKCAQCPQVTTLMTKLDTIAAEMPDTEKTKFITRFSEIIPNSATDYVQEYEDQFNEALVEFLGWDWLKEKYPTHEPKFNHLNSPDLLVYDNSKILACMECKRKRKSDEERHSLKSKGYIAGNVNLSNLYSTSTSENAFLRNLKDTICKAEQQVNQIRAEEKFIFLSLSPDMVYLPFGIDSLIQSLESDLNNKGIKLICFKGFQVDSPITGTV